MVNFIDIGHLTHGTRRDGMGSPALRGFFMYQVARDDTVSLEELQRQIAESEGSWEAKLGNWWELEEV